MRVAMVTAPGKTDIVEVADPTPGPRDVLIKMRACGICGSDAMYIAIGGIPPRQGRTPLGHEPAGEVLEVGSDVDGVKAGDHVVSTRWQHRAGSSETAARQALSPISC